MARSRGNTGTSGRKAMRSPGRPPVALREQFVRFWKAIAAGRTSDAAGIEAGVSPAVGVRWFRRAGGMAPSHLSKNSKPLSGRYLSFAEREEIAILYAQQRGVCEIARQLGRSASTVSRELRRNAATRSCGPITWRRTPVCGSMFRKGCPEKSALASVRLGDRLSKSGSMIVSTYWISGPYS